MQSGINLAANIALLRKGKKMTQEEVARHLGVTKASVSKWETGQSFPDIALLPRLASLFDVSIDRLMGFEPQMSTKDVKEACAQLRKEFASRPFDEVLDSCQQLANEYYACPALLSQLAALLMNHAMVAAPDQALRERTTGLAIKLCQRTRTLGSSVTDLRQANAVEGALELMGGRPDRTAELLQDAAAPSTGDLLVLASAYQALGEPDRARQVLQAGLFEMLVISLNVLAQMATTVWPGDLERIRTTHARAIAIIDAFDLDSLYLNVGVVHVSFAALYAAAGVEDEALECLERYLRVCKKMEFPLKIHGDDFFDDLGAYLEDFELDTSAPLDDTLVRMQLLQSVAANPAFACFADNPDFRRIVKELEVALR